MPERDPNDLGALWIKTNDRGDYMTGKILGQAVVCFLNKSKQPCDNRPDWKVLKPQPRPPEDETAF